MNSLTLLGIALFLGLLWYLLDSEAKRSVDEMEYLPPCPKGICDSSGLVDILGGTNDEVDAECTHRL